MIFFSLFWNDAGSVPISSVVPFEGVAVLGGGVSAARRILSLCSGKRPGADMADN